MKVLCKKDYIINSDIPKVIFYKDNFYEIYIDVWNVTTVDEYWIYSTDEQRIIYRFLKNVSFKEHFLTVSESRKYKLDKIQNELQ